DDRGIQKFDAIHISMLLLHLRKPFNLIKTLKQFLKPGGFIFIKDIDDGYSFAYPDPNGYFQKAVDFYKVCENGGFRQSGRQIYSYLRKTAFKDIKLELSGMNTIGLDYDLKSALYEIYIKGCIYVDSVAMRDKYPDDPRFSDFVDWLDENLDEMEAQFFDEGFFFTLGTMIFVGRA
ncbi:MAG: hypothetical protein MJ238_03295, partial [Bacilli bacterium]|nr:hypothetical protein [Bacilli bacterium]